MSMLVGDWSTVFSILFKKAKKKIPFKSMSSDCPAVKRLRKSMLCEVSVPFCENSAVKRKKILETIDDVVCGRDSITDQQARWLELFFFKNLIMAHLFMLYIVY